MDAGFGFASWAFEDVIEAMRQRQGKIRIWNKRRFMRAFIQGFVGSGVEFVLDTYSKRKWDFRRQRVLQMEREFLSPRLQDTWINLYKLTTMIPNMGRLTFRTGADTT